MDFIATKKSLNSYTLILNILIINIKWVPRHYCVYFLVKIFNHFIGCLLRCFSLGWRDQRLVHHRCRRWPTGTWCDPRVSCQSQPGPPRTGSTKPDHHGDGGRGRGCSSGGVIMNSCCGRSSGGGYRANMSTWSPLGRRATLQKAHLRGAELPGGQLLPPCHSHLSVAQHVRRQRLDSHLFSFSLLRTGEPTFFMDHILPLTSDPKRAFFQTQRQSCKRHRTDWLVLCVYKLLVGDNDTEKLT